MGISEEMQKPCDGGLRQFSYIQNRMAEEYNALETDRQKANNDF